jgi:phosphonate transport system substrate-binding protein
MITYLHRHLWQGFLGVLLATVPVWGQGQTSAQGYRFSPVNQFDIKLTAEHWNPILAYVSEKSGVKLHLKLGRTSQDTTSYVLAQEVEFVFSNHLFSPEREKLGWKVFGRRNLPPIHGQIAVLADSPITRLDQLKNQEMAFPGPEALVSYKFPYAHLLAQGVDVKVSFGGNTSGALAQLISGKVQAVGVNSQLLDGYAVREKKSFRVLWSSDPLYDLALMASSKVPEKDVKVVAQAFFGMAQDPKGREVLHQTSQLVGLSDDAVFMPSDGSEYSAYRRFYQNAPIQLR